MRGCWDLTRTSERRQSESLSEEVLSVELVEEEDVSSIAEYIMNSVAGGTVCSV